MNRSIRRITAFLMCLVLAAALACVPALAEPMQAAFSMTIAEDTTLGIRLLADDTAALLKLTASLAYQGNAITADAALSGSGLCFTIAPFMSEYYGVDLANFTINLSNSVLAPDSGSSFALDQETYDSLIKSFNEAIAGMDTGISTVSQTNSGSNELVEEYVALIQEGIAAGMSTQSFQDTVTVAGEKIDAACVIVSITPAALAGTITAVADKAAADEALAGLYAQSAAASNQSASYEEAIAQLKAAADGIKENSVSLTISTFTDRQTDAFVYCDIRMSNAEQASGVEIFNVSAVKKIQAYIYANESYEIPLGAELLINRLDDNGGEFVLHLIENGKNACIITLAYNMTAEDTMAWQLNAETLEAAYVLTGTVSAVNGTTTIALDEFNDAPCDAVLVIGAAESETAPEYTEILTMTEEEFTNFATLLMQISEAFGG